MLRKMLGVPLSRTVHVLPPASALSGLPRGSPVRRGEDRPSAADLPAGGWGGKDDSIERDGRSALDYSHRLARGRGGPRQCFREKSSEDSQHGEEADRVWSP